MNASMYVVTPNIKYLKQRRGALGKMLQMHKQSSCSGSVTSFVTQDVSTFMPRVIGIVYDAHTEK